ncbi:MAG: hypothetical protein C0467_31155 [Planctomycetaceae bacterium]|nr:hypothetical protein [Planctomycetaceae bacterium]
MSPLAGTKNMTNMVMWQFSPTNQPAVIMTKEQLTEEAEWLSAFGEPTRVAVVRALATGEKIVTELARILGAEMVNVSHHLGIMRHAGVVKSDRDGRCMRYSLVGASATAMEIVLTHKSGMRVVIPLY